MMEEMNVATDESYDSLDEQYDRPAERWAPLGAAMSSPSPGMTEYSCNSEAEQLRLLEEEQDQLNSSLLALTTHFAQVQFRLKQIVSAPTDEKEVLLRELEEFAFKGIPDIRGIESADTSKDYDDVMSQSEKEYDVKITEQRKKQQELIQQLKSQLEDLETYAYETGEADLPTSKVVEKQKVIIDQLRSKLNMEIEDLSRLSTDDLKMIVDKAIGQIVNPAKVKEKLVDQLKTQITDLERFIQFLQGEAQSPGPLGAKCTCPVHTPTAGHSHGHHHGHPHSPSKLRSAEIRDNEQKLHQTTLSIMKQALTVLQIFAISQFGCGGREFQKNLLKRTAKGNHWGDLRARLEIAIDLVIEQAKHHEANQPMDSDYTSDSEDAPVIQCNQALVTAVRKDLAMALRDLMQHGLMEIRALCMKIQLKMSCFITEDLSDFMKNSTKKGPQVGQSSSIVPFGCFPSRAPRKETEMMHAWDIFLKYYDMKHGKEYNESPARKLSDSFGLEMIGGKAVTAKQTLLSAVHAVISSHMPLKRSEDSQFKAFVCHALNERKLVTWLRLLLKTNALVEFYYQPWSYVVRTGFDDALQSLDRLTKISFHLPVDLAVRPFTNIRDAF